MAGTRLPLWVLYKAWKAGKSNAQLRRMYPVLKTAPLQHLREFAESHSDEMERQFAANEPAYLVAGNYQSLPSTSPPAGVTAAQ